MPVSVGIKQDASTLCRLLFQTSKSDNCFPRIISRIFFSGLIRRTLEDDFLYESFARSNVLQAATAVLPHRRELTTEAHRPKTGSIKTRAFDPANHEATTTMMMIENTQGRHRHYRRRRRNRQPAASSAPLHLTRRARRDARRQPQTPRDRPSFAPIVRTRLPHPSVPLPTSITGQMTIRSVRISRVDATATYFFSPFFSPYTRGNDTHENYATSLNRVPLGARLPAA